MDAPSDTSGQLPRLVSVESVEIDVPQIALTGSAPVFSAHDLEDLDGISGSQG